MNLIDVFKECEDIANKKYDGQFILLKFTTNWRFCFGTPDDLSPYFTGLMAEGKTAEEAIQNGIKNDVNSEKIYKFLEDDGVF